MNIYLQENSTQQQEDIMSDNVRLGSPALSTELDKAFGNSGNQETVSLRDSNDVSEFLKAVEKSERDSEKVNLKFG